MSPSRPIEGVEDKGLGSAESSRVLQNPQQNSHKPKPREMQEIVRPPMCVEREIRSFVVSKVL
jgi:hypothetical protein